MFLLGVALDGQKVRYLVLGAGPNGQVSVDALLETKKASDICLVDARINEYLAPAQRIELSLDFKDKIERNRRHGGMGKLDFVLSDKSPNQGSGSNFWGASCLPPSNWELAYGAYKGWDIKNSLVKASKFLELQAVYEGHANSPFGYFGEEFNSLSRKKAANQIAKQKNSFFHSRLAITSLEESSNKCSFRSMCFDGCPNNAPWSATKSLKNLVRNNPNLLIYEGHVIHIDMKGKKVVFKDGTSIFYEKLFLSIGAENTKRLLEYVLETELKLNFTPVVLNPFVTLKKSTQSDFSQHFVYTDLIFPVFQDKTLTSITQLYLPTQEISARILSRLPKMLSRFLSFKKIQDILFSRIGIAMTFLSQVEVNSPPKKVYVQKSKFLFSRIFFEFIRCGLFFLPLPRVKLSEGESHHIGGLSYKSEIMSGVESLLFAELAEKDVFLTDTSNLEHVPPGPHTLTSMALSISIVCKYT
jgi:hypothetical protein